MQAEEELRESEEKYRELFQNESDAVMIFDAETLQFEDANRATLALFGYTEEEFLTLKVDDISAEKKKTEVAVEKVKKEEPGSEKIPLRYMIKKDGTIFPAEISAGIFTSKGRKKLIGAIRDITERKQAEEQLRASLKEKEVLLQELYHRTKNNMQVICAMLGLQASYTKDEQVLKIFKETENRIKSMALVHQKLYQSKNLSSIDLKEYISELVNLLVKSYVVESNRISPVFDMDSVFVLIDTAIPCGLILNELISNSLQYAFPGDMEGEISIRLKKTEEGEIELRVSDDGVGVPKDFAFRKSGTLGFQNVFAIVEHQLQGEVKFDVNNGITCQIRFKDTLYSQRV